MQDGGGYKNDPSERQVETFDPTRFNPLVHVYVTASPVLKGPAGALVPVPTVIGGTEVQTVKVKSNINTILLSCKQIIAPISNNLLDTK